MHDHLLHGLPEGLKCMQDSIIAKICQEKSEKCKNLCCSDPRKDCHKDRLLSSAEGLSISTPLVYYKTNKQILHYAFSTVFAS